MTFKTILIHLSFKTMQKIYLNYQYLENIFNRNRHLFGWVGKSVKLLLNNENYRTLRS